MKRIEEKTPNLQRAESIEQKPHLDSFVGPLGEEFDESATDHIVSEDKHHDVNRFFGLENLLFEDFKGLLAGEEEIESVALRGWSGTGPEKRISIGPVFETGWEGGLGSTESVFVCGESAEFSSSKQEIEGHSDVRDEHDDHEPGEGGARLAFFPHQPSDEKNRQQKTANGENVRKETGENPHPDSFGGADGLHQKPSRKEERFCSWILSSSSEREREASESSRRSGSLRGSARVS